MTKLEHLGVFEHKLNTIYSQLSDTELNKTLTAGEFINLLQSSVRDAKLDILEKEHKRTQLPNQGMKRCSIKGRAVHNFIRDKLKEI